MRPAPGLPAERSPHRHFEPTRFRPIHATKEIIDVGPRCRRVASAVRDLDLDLDAFEGPFDLLLTLLLKEGLEPKDVDLAAVVVAFVETLA